VITDTAALRLDRLAGTKYWPPDHHPRAAGRRLRRRGLAGPVPPPVTRVARSSRTLSANTTDLSPPRIGADGRQARETGTTQVIMQIPGVHIETLHNPVRYTYAQIEKACAIAQVLNRGKLVLVEPPRR
jgi:hypothetical protein